VVGVLSVCSARLRPSFSHSRFSFFLFFSLFSLIQTGQFNWESKGTFALAHDPNNRLYHMGMDAITGHYLTPDTMIHFTNFIDENERRFHPGWDPRKIPPERD
jgi:hypothetical protein